MRQCANIPRLFFGCVVIAVFIMPGVVALSAPGDENWDDQFRASDLLLEPTFGDPGVTSLPSNVPVRAVAFIGNDVYIGGRFTEVAGLPIAGLAKWDGMSWSAVGGWDEPLEAMTVIGSDLYVGGKFLESNGMPFEGVAKWDGVAWTDVGGGVEAWPGGGSIGVFAMTSQGSDLYVAGQFHYAAGGAVDLDEIARWDGSNWHDVGGGLSGLVRELVFVGTDLYVGGTVHSAGPSPALVVNDIVKWDGVNWSWVGGDATTNGVNATLWSMATDGTDLYVGGQFTEAGGLPISQLAKWDGDVWSEVGGGIHGSVNGPHAITVDGGNVFVGGNLGLGGDGVDVGAVNIRGVGRWDGTRWFDMNGGLRYGNSENCYALAVKNSELFVGGRFTEHEGMTANHLARFQNLDADPNTVDHFVRAIVQVGGNTYLGGDFKAAAGSVVNHVVRWDETVWHPVGSGVNGTVRALVELNGDVYAAGDFTEAGGSSANRVARWDGAAWHPLGVGIDGSVRALATDGVNLYAAGDFANAGGQPAMNISMWDGAAWSDLNGGTNGIVNDLALYKGELYAVGDFTSAGAAFALNIGRWDGAAWDKVGFGIGQPVNAVAAAGGYLYAGGDFSLVIPNSINRLARWDGISWSTVDDGAGGDGVPDVVRTLYGYNGNLYVGGDFTSVGNLTANHLALLSGGSWTAFGSGMDGSVEAIAVKSDEGGSSLFVGGKFSNAGGKTSQFFAHFNALVTAIPSGDVTPRATQLYQNHPNPFNPTTTIEFDLAESAHVTLTIYDVYGRRLTTLLNERMTGGLKHVTWDGKNEAGRNVTSGVYFYRLHTGATVQTQRMVLLK